MNYLKTDFLVKCYKNFRNRLETEVIENCANEKNFKEQPKLTFSGIHKSYTNHSIYTFNQNEVLRDKPIYAGFAILELSKLTMYESNYDKSQPYYGQEKINYTL